MFTVLDLKVSSFLMLMNAIIRGKFSTLRDRLHFSHKSRASVKKFVHKALNSIERSIFTLILTILAFGTKNSFR